MWPSGSFENEDWSTKHPNLENEAPKTRKQSILDRKQRPLNLANEAPKSRKRRPQNSKTKHLNQVEAADVSAPPKIHKIHPNVL